MSLIDDFKTRFPEDFETADVDQYVPILEPILPAYYGADYDPTKPIIKETILNLVAHLLVMEVEQDGPEAVRSVNSQSAGSVSESYNAPVAQDASLETFQATKYGQRFLLLTRRNYGGVPV